MRRFFFIFLLSIFSIPTFEQSAYLNLHDEFVKNFKILEQADSILTTLKLEEKIGQLFMIGANGNTSQEQLKTVEENIEKYHIGGIIFFKGNPTQQAKLTNKYQSLSKIPLFIAIDGEWGISMRLDSVIQFPKQMTLGAITDNALIYEMGRKIADQCKRLGIQINFAPVIDINNNPENPVIHMRSFGENKENVTTKGYAYMKGLQDNGVMAVAKHFPGHGDTDVDSHEDLPVIRHNKKRIEELELYPFKYLIDKGVDGIMVAHLHIPAYDNSKKLPTTLSSKVVNDLLINRLNYQGLVFTDALRMKGVSNYFKAGEAEVKAFQAGNHILLLPQDIEKAVNEIKKAINDGSITEAYLNQKVRKILASKIKYGLFEQKKIDLKRIHEDLNTTHFQLLKRYLIEASTVLLRNNDNLVPLSNLHHRKTASLAIGPLKANKFQETLSLYSEVDAYQAPNHIKAADAKELVKKLNEYNTIIISLHNISQYNVKTFGLSEEIIEFINSFSDKKDILLVNLGSPYALKYFQNFNNIIQAFENDDEFQDITAQAIFGGIPIRGKMPVSVGQYKEGEGLLINHEIRLKYTLPEEVGIRSINLKPIDSIVNYAINNKAMPGCQILIAKDGKVIFNRSYGYHTYEQKIKVQNTDLYDLASITKITATLLPVMRFYEMGRLMLQDKIEKFFSDSSKYKYSETTIKNLLLHEAGFEPWIAFYKQTMKDKPTFDRYYKTKEQPGYTVPVTKNLYAINGIEDSIWATIYDTKIKEKGKYNYSDLDFIFLKRVVDTLTKQDFSSYLFNNFYAPLGMNHTLFNPFRLYDPSTIPPTEDDKYFRNQIIHAYVHDPAAAMLGGVAGHAGLFSNANDMAKYFAMLLNNGKYGGENYFNQNTINLFTSKQSKDSRRGLGFDKPVTDPNVHYGPTSENTPSSAFGHTGFTGTCAWADPDKDVIYIFLSNRTYPDSGNKKLLRFNTRTEIQRVIYEAIRKNSTH